jgi:hypothetical protein
MIHIQQAELNEEGALYNQLKYPHICIVMCFYAALQYVEGYAAWFGDDIYALYTDVEEVDQRTGELKRRRLTQHERLEMYVTDISVRDSCEDLSISYKRLHRASNTARYLKGIKDKNKTAGQHFKGADFYIERLQIVKTRLQINSIKTSIEKLDS